MTNQSVPTPASQEASRYLPLLLILFAGSGCSALIYEIVWYQLAATGHRIHRRLAGLPARHLHGRPVPGQPGPSAPARRRQTASPAHLCRAGTGHRRPRLLVLWCLPLVDRVYIAGAEHGMPGMLLRGFISAVCLLPPTILMGASLPAIVRWIEVHPRGVSWWGLLYGGNTAGAVFGCLLAGFYLLRIYNMAVATYCGRGHQPGGGAASASGWPPARPPNSAPGEIPERPGRQSRSDDDPAPLAGLRHHRPLRRLRAGRRSGLDAPDGHAARAPRSTCSPSSWRSF